MPRPAVKTRDALLDAALEAFARKGFDGASIREITKVVGVRESAFYAHFASKRAAYEELFREAGPPMAATALDALADAGPAEFLPAFATAVITAWSAPRARKFAAMLMRDALDDDAQGWRALKRSVDGVLQLLAARIRRWRADGLVPEQFSDEAFAFAFLAPLAMARFMFFNVAAAPTDGERGHAIIDAHVASFVALATAARGRKEQLP